MPKAYLTSSQKWEADVKENLRILIYRAGTNQKALSRDTGIKPSTLQKRLRDPETMRIGEALKIFKALGVPLSEGMKALQGNEDCN